MDEETMQLVDAVSEAWKTVVPDGEEVWVRRKDVIKAIESMTRYSARAYGNGKNKDGRWIERWKLLEVISSLEPDTDEQVEVNQ